MGLKAIITCDVSIQGRQTKFLYFNSDLRNWCHCWFIFFSLLTKRQQTEISVKRNDLLISWYVIDRILCCMITWHKWLSDLQKSYFSETYEESDLLCSLDLSLLFITFSFNFLFLLPWNNVIKGIMQDLTAKHNILTFIGKGAHKPKAHTAVAYFRFPKQEANLGVFLLPPGWDESPSQGYPPAVCHWYPFIHLGEGRQSGVKFLV